MKSVRKSELALNLRQGAVEIVRCLRDAGFKAYWAGGCVRDMLLGQEPADYDIATSALPDQVIALFPRCVEVGKAFGVIQVLDGDLQYDVATFRAEGSYTDGRRPDEVTWADPREDVIRRDFTINGLLYDPLDDKVIDFVNGESDLKKGVIRAIGEPARRFEEDALRVLRALRFSARLDFNIEPQTWRALEDAAPSIARISTERIRHELERILTEGGAKQGLEMMEALGLWELLVPELRDLPLAIKRFTISRKLSPQVAWANLCLDQALSRTEIQDFGKRMRLSKGLIDKLVSTIGCATSIRAYEELPIWDRKKVVRHTCFDDATQLLKHDETAKGAIRAALEELSSWSQDELYPAPLLTGQTLAMAGYQPGPFFGHVLGELENLQLAGEVTTEAQALAFVKSQAPKPD